MGDVARQANSFVGTLAQLQDSEKILASNEQAAREALERLAAARKEEEEVRARTTAHLADVDRMWRDTAAKIEAGERQVVEMRERATAQYNEIVSEAVRKAKEVTDGIKDETKALIVERDRKKLEVQSVDEEVAAHRAVLTEVRKEMGHLATRLTT